MPFDDPGDRGVNRNDPEGWAAADQRLAMINAMIADLRAEEAADPVAYAQREAVWREEIIASGFPGAEPVPDRQARPT